jgi:PAS domain S-box-containing protein
MNLFVLTASILCAALLASSALALIVWRYRRAPGAMPMIAIAVPILVWLFSSTGELWSRTLETKVIWANLQYLGIVTVPVAYFMLALAVSQPDIRLSLRRWASVLVMPFVSLLVLWTNSWHGWFRADVQLLEVNSMSVLSVTLGPWFWVHTAYSYLFLGAGIVLLMRHAALNRQRRPLQFVLMALSALVPFIANLAYLTLGIQVIPVDPTPISLLFSALLMTYVIVKLNFFDVIRGAAQTFIDNMEDIMLVLDDNQRVLTASRSTEQFFDVRLAELRGQKVGQLVPEIQQYLTNTDISLGVDCQLRVSHNGQLFDMELRVTPVHDSNSDYPRGCLVILRDLSAVMLAEQRLSLAMQASRQGFWDLDMETGKIYYSPEWKRLLGYKNHELADNSGLARQLTPADQWQQLKQRVQQAVEAGENWVETEFQMQHRDGHRVNVLARTMLIRNAEGKLIRQIGTHLVMPGSGAG